MFWVTQGPPSHLSTAHLASTFCFLFAWNVEFLMFPKGAEIQNAQGSGHRERTKEQRACVLPALWEERRALEGLPPTQRVRPGTSRASRHRQPCPREPFPTSEYERVKKHCKERKWTLSTRFCFCSGCSATKTKQKL